MIQKSHLLLERYINSRIIYNILDEEAWNKYVNQFDHVLEEALKVFKNNASFPTLPTDNAHTKKGKKVASLDNTYYKMSIRNANNITANKA